MPGDWVRYRIEMLWLGSWGSIVVYAYGARPSAGDAPAGGAVGGAIAPVLLRMYSLSLN